MTILERMIQKNKDSLSENQKTVRKKTGRRTGGVRNYRTRKRKKKVSSRSKAKIESGRHIPGDIREIPEQTSVKSENLPGDTGLDGTSEAISDNVE